MNSRRKFFLATGASALTAPFASRAQQPGRNWRVGFLSVRHIGPLDADFYGMFPRTMRLLGYVEGRNLVIDWRSAEGQPERLAGLAAELVQLKVDAIVAAAPQSVRAAQQATSTIPIVMGTAGDPVAAGLVKSLARPGGNTTGTSTNTIEIAPKLLEMLLGMKPGLTRVAVMYNPLIPVNAVTLGNLQAVAPRVGVSLLPLEVRTSAEIEAAFALMKRDNAGAFILIQDPLFTLHLRRIAELAAQHRLPSVAGIRQYVEAGGLMNYGPSFADNYRQAAVYVDKIFKGAKPADLPVEQPVKFDMYINGKTAKALGLTIPQALLISADKVIE